MTDVKLSGSGPNLDVEAQVDPIFQALRASVRPYDWGTPGEPQPQGGGHYFFESASGALTGAAANSPLCSLRWDEQTYQLILLRCSLWFYLTTAYTTGQMNDFELIRATAFTAADTGGGAVTPLKKRNTMGPSRVQDLRVCTTAALGAGTRTLDGAGIRAVVDGPANAAIPTVGTALSRNELLLYDAKEAGGHPLVLTKNEGLIIRNITAMSAAGVIKAFFAMEWAEVAVF